MRHVALITTNLQDRKKPCTNFELCSFSLSQNILWGVKF